MPSPLIDILSSESFAAEHLAGAVNICVYETVFIDKIRAAFPDTTILLTVYGLNSSTLEASVAVKKLEAAGCRRVQVVEMGDLAYVRTTSAGKTEILAKKTTVTEGNNELFIFRKEHGKWKIHRYLFASTNPPEAK